MPLDPRAARFLDMMGAAAAGREGARDISERRMRLVKLMRFAAADRLSPPGRDVDLAGMVDARLYAPENIDHDMITPGIVFFHGGGLVAGSVETHDVIARALCAASRCRLLSVDYRLAPEHPFPAALEDAIAATRDTISRAAAFGIDAARLALVGESGGGALAVLAAHEPQMSCALLCLICPVLDFSSESASRKEFAKGYLIDRDLMEGDFDDYLQGRVPRDDPRISPLLLPDLRHLPRTMIHAAEFDPLRDEGRTFAKRLAEAGVAVTYEEHAGMVHNFHALGGVLPQGKEALRMIGQDIGNALRA
jgi:acetyl esterase